MGWLTPGFFIPLHAGEWPAQCPPAAKPTWVETGLVSGKLGWVLLKVTTRNPSPISYLYREQSSKWERQSLKVHGERADRQGTEHPLEKGNEVYPETQPGSFSYSWERNLYFWGYGENSKKYFN